MTHQPDMLGHELDEATTRRIDLPQPREVRKPRLRDVLGHELILPERARGEHR